MLNTADYKDLTFGIEDLFFITLNWPHFPHTLTKIQNVSDSRIKILHFDNLQSGDYEEFMRCDAICSEESRHIEIPTDLSARISGS